MRERQEGAPDLHCGKFAFASEEIYDSRQYRLRGRFDSLPFAAALPPAADVRPGARRSRVDPSFVPAVLEGRDELLLATAGA